MARGEAVALRPRPPARGCTACRRRFSASPGQTRAILADVLAGLACVGIDPDSCGDVEIVLAEAINNVVEHAYGGNGGTVELELWLRDDGLHCEIGDWGIGMPDSALPLARLPALDAGFDRVPEGGFGWALIHRLTTDLSYARSKGRNCLRFRIPMLRGVQAATPG